MHSMSKWMGPVLGFWWTVVSIVIVYDLNWGIEKCTK